jgi:hypothetical protein
MWLAERARQAGLEPAGDDGTYFQFWPLKQVRLSASSSVALGSTALAYLADVVVFMFKTAFIDAPLVLAGDGKADALANLDLEGKVAVIRMTPPARQIPQNVSLRPARYAFANVTERVPAVVPLSSIVAVLNADMIGGNSPDSAALLGVQPPHLNSRDLADMALRANDQVSRFGLDTLWDRPSHPENWYFRSDHVPYARLGIPSIYFSSLPHPLYHTPLDDPGHINFAKVTRIARWMSATGWTAANASERVKPIPDSRPER